MTTSRTPYADALRSEIARAGAAASGRDERKYLEETDAHQIVSDLRRAEESGAAVGLLLRLDDETAALAVAALKGRGAGGELAAGVGESARLADALAESYIDGERMRVLLGEAEEQIQRLLKRVERAGTVLESDAGARDALALLGTIKLYREEPENENVVGLIEGMAERARRLRPTAKAADRPAA
jgi:hypothetical protein